MNRTSAFSAALMIAAGTSLSADLEPQPQLSFTEGASDTWNADWAGVSARTYFLQCSLDLATWSYAPIMEFGTGVKSIGVSTDNADKFFVRLQYSDDPALSNVDEARVADFDQDGMPNYWEITHGLNPTDSTGINGASGDLDGDGFNNLREYYFETAPDDAAGLPTGKIAAGPSHSIALTADGRLWGWGNNYSGELGDGTTTGKNSPVPVLTVTGMSLLVDIEAGNGFSAALDEAGVLWAWGKNGENRISREATYAFKSPVRAELPAPVARFACGLDHTVAVDRDGRIWAWGSNTFGQLGTEDTAARSAPVEVMRPPGMGRVVEVGAGARCSYAIDASGMVWAWGYNGNGALGNGTYINQYLPVATDTSNGTPRFRSIKAGDGFALALGEDGTVWSWGSSSYGQLGTGAGSSNKPLRITAGPADVRAIGAGGHHGLSASGTGAVWSWGRNAYGELGDGSSTQRDLPVQTTAVTGFSDLERLAGGYYFSLAVKGDGTIWSWGYNYSSQLGHGDSLQRTAPTQISGLKLAYDDSDEDGLPDSWERFHFAGGLSQAGGDIAVANGVTNTVAYALGLNPLNPDNDNDGISDNDEIAAGLDPLDWSDATGDLDGDRIPNVWEQEMGSDMNDGLSAPAVSATVASGQSIQSAIDAVTGNTGNPSWAIIGVEPGLYQENITLPVNKRILLISAAGIGIPEIRGSSAGATVTIYGESVIDGFRITHAQGFAGCGVYLYPYGGKAIARMVNCIVSGHTGTDGGGIYGYSGRLAIAHCSVFGNSATTRANGVYLESSATTEIVNSIFWNPNGGASEEIVNRGVSSALQTIVSDGSITGALTHDPRLNPSGMLTKDSPARNQGLPLASVHRDIHQEARGMEPDIGADEFFDSDDDGLPDWWEMHHFGNLSKGADDDNDLPEIDLLTNRYEYLLGYDPNNPDTRGDGAGDLFHAVTEGLGASRYPPEWMLDPDLDGLRDGLELLYGTSPVLFDTNGDGIGDLTALQLGFTATGTDTDGDGISNAQELIDGTSPFLADSDMDGVADNLDAFVLDPSRWDAPAGTPGDVTAPQIVLITPENATTL